MRQPHPSVSPGAPPGARRTRPPVGTRQRPLRLPLHPNPLRLLVCASPWRAAGYLLGSLLVSGILFAVALTTCTVAAALAVTVALAPLLIGAAAVVRGCAQVERLLLRQVSPQPVRACYPPTAGPGLWRRARSAWASGATWRDLAYLTGLWPFRYTLDAAVFAIWASLAAGMALPLWYSHVADVCFGVCGSQHRTPGVLFGHYPNGPHGAGASGLYVDSTGAALLVAACCLVAFLLWNYVLVLTARLDGRVGSTLLRRSADPLAPARTVLAAPGPLLHTRDP